MLAKFFKIRKYKHSCASSAVPRNCVTLVMTNSECRQKRVIFVIESHGRPWWKECSSTRAQCLGNTTSAMPRSSENLGKQFVLPMICKIT
eukprot:1117845-Karenia_brevis.AAC.1